MNEKISIYYRSFTLDLNRSLYEEFKHKHGFYIEEADLDQYLFNGSDKTIHDEHLLVKILGK